MRNPLAASKLRVPAAISAAVVVVASLPAPALAQIKTVGSPLSVYATLNTARNLSYAGVNTPVPPSPEAPDGIFHTFHFGADTAIWNQTSPHGASMPASGQALKVSLEGCAEAAPGGPPPLTQIHFQDLSPLRGGGAKVKLSSQPFDIPVCGVRGASGSTVTTYKPINLCVRRGDYVGFNDEGGYVENIYRSGVPYMVLGRVRRATADSFIRHNGTGNGSVFSPHDRSAMDGFAANRNVELLLRVLLGTGRDASFVCPGGRRR